MARVPTPWKHPKTGTYWIRLRVPDRLQESSANGFSSAPLAPTHPWHQRTLGTKNVAEAKVRFADALSELKER